MIRENIHWYYHWLKIKLYLINDITLQTYYIGTRYIILGNTKIMVSYLDSRYLNSSIVFIFILSSKNFF